VQQQSLEYAGTVSTFSGAFTATQSGEYELRVIASQPEEANFGKASSFVTVR